MRGAQAAVAIAWFASFSPKLTAAFAHTALAQCLATPIAAPETLFYYQHKLTHRFFVSFAFHTPCLLI
jgi:hypothetical protein